MWIGWDFSFVVTGFFLPYADIFSRATRMFRRIEDLFFKISYSKVLLCFEVESWSWIFSINFKFLRLSTFFCREFFPWHLVAPHETARIPLKYLPSKKNTRINQKQYFFFCRQKITQFSIVQIHIIKWIWNIPFLNIFTLQTEERNSGSLIGKTKSQKLENF